MEIKTDLSDFSLGIPHFVLTWTQFELSSLFRTHLATLCMSDRQFVLSMNFLCCFSQYGFFWSLGMEMRMFSFGNTCCHFENHW